MILLATILASGMAFLDGTVVNIAIPTIQAKLQASFDQMQWVINSYMLMLAALILVSGSLGDRFGRKRIFSYGIGFFVFSSFLCSIAQSIEQLIFFRAVQGIGAAMMIPGSLSIISASFADHVRGKAIGLWSGLAGGVVAFGPFLGGWLVETFSWPSIFYINIPIGIIALLITRKYVPESKNSEATRLDLAGTFTIFLSLLGICFAFIQAPEFGWRHPFIMLSLICGIISFVVFLVIEKKSKEPLVPMQLFASPLVVGANLVTFFLYFALSGLIFFLILNLQQLQHFSPLVAGLSMLPSILFITFLSGPAGGWSDKHGPRTQMIVGPLMVAIGMFLLSITGKHVNYFIDILPGLVLFGLGMALVIAPLTKSALSVEQKFSGAASGVNNAVSRVAGLLAVALLGTIVIFLFSAHLQTSLVNSTLTSSQQQEILIQKNMLGAVAIPDNLSVDEKTIAQESVEDAFLYSFRWAMGINAILALLSAVIAYVTIHTTAKKSS